MELKEKIVVNGYLTQERSKPFRAEINISQIFSFLIKEVGTLVTSYAGDIFYDLKEIERCVKEDNPTNKSMLIGLREMGVDGTDIINLRKASPEIYGNPYIEIFSIEFVVDNIYKDCKLILTRVE